MAPEPIRTRILIGATTAETVDAFLAEQAEYLSTQGFDVHMAASGLSGGYGHAESVVCRHDLEMNRTISPIRDLLSFVEWVKLIRLLNPDLLYAGTPKAGLLAMFAGLLNRVPRRVYLVRGLRYQSLTGLMGRTAILMERLACWASTEVVAVSPSVATALESDGITSAAKTSVVGCGSSNGVDTLRFAMVDETRRKSSRSRWGIEGKTFAVGFAGRLRVDKGLSDLIDAVNLLKAAGIEVTLLVAGAIDQSDPQSLTLMKRLDDAEARVLGRIDHLEDFYWSLDLFVLPSHREGMPNVNLEAASCGIPVVTSDATGCVDSIAPFARNGIFASRDPKSLAQVIQGQMAMRNDDRVLLAAQCRDWVVRNFERETVWQAYRDYLLRGPADMQAGV